MPFFLLFYFAFFVEILKMNGKKRHIKNQVRRRKISVKSSNNVTNILKHTVQASPFVPKYTFHAQVSLLCPSDPLW